MSGALLAVNGRLCRQFRSQICLPHLFAHNVFIRDRGFIPHHLSPPSHTCLTDASVPASEPHTTTRALLPHLPPCSSLSTLCLHARASRPDFATVIRITRGRAYPTPQRRAPSGASLSPEQETPRGCAVRAARWGWPSHTACTLPHNPGTPRWHAGVRDGRAGVGGDRHFKLGVWGTGERGPPIPGPGGPSDCPRVRCGLG